MSDYTVRPPLARCKGKQKTGFVRFLMSVFPVKGDEAVEIVRKLVFITAVAAFVITGGSLLSEIFGQLRQIYIVEGQIEQDKINGSLNLSAEEIDRITEEQPYIRDEMMGLYSANSDLVGWINIGGEDKLINNAVVQGTDNDMYLVTDFYGGHSSSGTIFADYRAPFAHDGSAPNFLVLFGHNTSAQISFSKVTRYYYDRDNLGDGTNPDVSFYRKYPTIYFDTLNQEGEYKVFAVCLFNTEEQYGETYNYLRRGQPFINKEDFNAYILDIMDRSLLFTDVDLQYGDDILCLSTCYFPFGMEYENVRCAVFARKIREGESREVNIDAARRNYAWVGWQQAKDRGLCGNGQRVWDYRKYLLSY